MRKLIASALLAAAQISAQSRAEIRGTLGYGGFVDEAIFDLPHLVAGGSVRVYLTRRLSIEPEFLYMRGPGADRDLALLPNVAFDLTRRPNARVVPYLIGGVGLLRHREQTGRGIFWANRKIFGGGFGAKIFLTERLFVAPEAWVGWEPFLRVSGSLGYVLSRRE